MILATILAFQYAHKIIPVIALLLVWIPAPILFSQWQHEHDGGARYLIIPLIQTFIASVIFAIAGFASLRRKTP
jgi:hypothetical protein